MSVTTRATSSAGTILLVTVISMEATSLGAEMSATPAPRPTTVEPTTSAMDVSELWYAARLVTSTPSATSRSCVAWYMDADEPSRQPTAESSTSSASNSKACGRRTVTSIESMTSSCAAEIVTVPVGVVAVERMHVPEVQGTSRWRSA